MLTSGTDKLRRILSRELHTANIDTGFYEPKYVSTGPSEATIKQDWDYLNTNVARHFPGAVIQKLFLENYNKHSQQENLTRDLSKVLSVGCGLSDWGMLLLGSLLPLPKRFRPDDIEDRTPDEIAQGSAKAVVWDMDNFCQARYSTRFSQEKWDASFTAVGYTELTTPAEQFRRVADAPGNHLPHITTRVLCVNYMLLLCHRQTQVTDSKLQGQVC